MYEKCNENIFGINKVINNEIIIFYSIIISEKLIKTLNSQDFIEGLLLIPERRHHNILLDYPS